jgi:hypothetical protein
VGPESIAIALPLVEEDAIAGRVAKAGAVARAALFVRGAAIFIER